MRQLILQLEQDNVDLTKVGRTIIFHQCIFFSNYASEILVNKTVLHTKDKLIKEHELFNIEGQVKELLTNILKTLLQVSYKLFFLFLFFF